MVLIICSRVLEELYTSHAHLCAQIVLCERVLSSTSFCVPRLSVEQGVRDANPYMTSLSSFLGFSVYGSQGVLLGPLIVCLATLVYGGLAWFLRTVCSGEGKMPDSCGGSSGVSQEAGFAHHATSGATATGFVSSFGLWVWKKKTTCFFNFVFMHVASFDECHEKAYLFDWVGFLSAHLELSNGWPDSCHEATNSLHRRYVILECPPRTSI